MGDEERIAMLTDLKETKKTLEGEIMKFPITMRTMAIRKRKEEMEEQVEKVNANIKVFSKQIVYVGI